MAIQTRTNKDGIVRYSATDKIKVDAEGRPDVTGRFRKSVQLGTFATEREAEAAIAKHRLRQEQIADGELPAAFNPKRTFGQAIDAFLADVKSRDVADRGGRSYETYESRLRVHVSDDLRALPLTKVTESKLKDLQRKLRKQMKESSVGAVFITISSCLSYAQGEKWIATNPARELLPSEREINAGKVERWLTMPQVTTLLTHCKPNLRAIVTVLVGTGIRIDECLHLRSGDVDLSRGTLNIQRGRKGLTKSGKPREIAITDVAMPTIKERMLAAGKNGLLFPGMTRDKDGNVKPRARQTTWKGIKAALKRAGLDPKLTVHDLRHSYATAFMQNTGSIFELSKVLGHQDSKITQRTYAHFDPTANAANRTRVSFEIPNDEGGKVIKLAAAKR